MILYIDTHQRGLVKFGLLGSGYNEHYHAQGRTDVILQELNKQIKINWQKEINGILVVNGPGPFSAIRGGVLVANLLARSLVVPLYRVSVSEFDDNQNLLNQIKNNKLEPIDYVIPIYDSEPNITC